MSTSNDAGSPRKRLPARPSAENLRKQAKHLARTESVQLARAQHRIAVAHGCRDWGDLMRLVEAMNRSAGVPLMSSSGVPNKPMQAAARAKDLDAVRRLLDAGQYTQEELDAGLAGALWYGDVKTQWPSMKAIADLLLEYGADVDGHFGAYGPIVFGTGECLMPESLQYLIDNGADVTFGPIDTKYGMQCPMSYWLGTYARGHNDRKHRGIEILLEHKAYIPPELHPAILAIHRGDTESLSRLIDADPSLPRRRFADMPYGNMKLDGATLLHCAVEFGELECIDLLLDRWMDANPRADVINGIGGQTPVYHAIAAGNLSALEHYVKRLGYAIDCRRVRATFKVFDTVYDTPMSPLEYAEKMSGDDTPAWKRPGPRELELVRSTDAPGSVNPVVSTPLDTAASTGAVQAVRTLLGQGADANGTNRNTPLWFACRSGADAGDRLAVAALLLDAGADVNRRCEAGSTALHLAAWRGPVGMVKLLLDRGGRAWLEDDKGKKAEDYARGSGVNPQSDPIVRLLSEIDFGDEQFQQAVAMLDAGDVEGLKRLLKGHPRLVTARVTGDSAITRGYFSRPTLLHFVAVNPTRNNAAHMPPRVLESTAAILDAGAAVDASTDHALGGTTLALVASSLPAHTDSLAVPMLELLAQWGADPAAGLAAALIHRFVDTARALLRLGAAHTLLSAASLGEIAVLREGLHGATDAERLMAAWASAINGQAEALDVLIDAGTPVNARLPRPFDPTLLHEAALNGHRAACERLLARGADPTLRDTQYNGTPAGWATHAGHADLAALLESAEVEKGKK